MRGLNSTDPNPGNTRSIAQTIRVPFGNMKHELHRAGSGEKPALKDRNHQVAIDDLFNDLFDVLLNDLFHDLFDDP